MEAVSHTFPAGPFHRTRERGRRVEHGVAGWGTGRHRRFDMAQRHVGRGDDRLHIPQHRAKVVVPSTVRSSPHPHWPVDEHVAGRCEGQTGVNGRRRQRCHQRHGGGHRRQHGPSLGRVRMLDRSRPDHHDPTSASGGAPNSPRLIDQDSRSPDGRAAVPCRHEDHDLQTTRRPLQRRAPRQRPQRGHQGPRPPPQGAGRGRRRDTPRGPRGDARPMEAPDQRPRVVSGCQARVRASLPDDA